VEWNLPGICKFYQTEKASHIVSNNLSSVIINENKSNKRTKGHIYSTGCARNEYISAIIRNNENISHRQGLKMFGNEMEPPGRKYSRI
jgi:hypothetical protein